MVMLQMLCNIYPIRIGIIQLLKPSEIMDLCIATRMHLTMNEKRKFLYSLREIFYSPLMPEVITCGTHMALLGSDVDKLLDSRHGNIHVGLLSHTPELETTSEHASTSDLTTSVCTLSNVWPDVNIVAFNTYGEETPITDKRVTVYTCIMSSTRTYVLSLNLLLNTIRMNTTLMKFKYTRHISESPVELQFILYVWFEDNTGSVYRRVVNGTEYLVLTKYNDRRCSCCSGTLYTSVSIDKYYWPSFSTIGAIDITWRLWSMERQSMSDLPEVEDFEPCVVVV